MFEKVWIFALKEQLTTDALVDAETYIACFLKNWSSHGNEVQASFSVVDNQIIVLTATPTGCAIDKMYREFSKNFDLIDENQVVVEVGGKMEILDRSEFKTLFKNGKINNESIVVDTSLSTGEDLTNLGLKRKLGESWHSKLL